MKYFKRLMVIFLLLLNHSLFAQPNLTKVEYFIDTDPGFGLATNITVPASTNDFANQIINIDPTALTEGMHTLYIRAKDANGSWSHTTKYIFIKVNASASATVPNLNALEYFIDTDPGFGMATNITVPASTTDLANQIINIDPTALTEGMHTLYIRAKDANGSWSHTTKYIFIKGDASTSATVPNLNALEYFIDTDPGFGMATNITVPASTADFANQIINIDPTALTEGLHTLYIRAKDANGHWSHTNKYIFIKDFTSNAFVLRGIKYAEYFIDTDPGYYNASQIAITPSTDISNIILSANITGLAAGNHFLYTRAIDSLGKWSHTDSLSFNVPTLISSPAITTHSINKFTLCAGSNLYIGYQATGTYNAGNVFSVQLSDAAGSFASPIVIANKASIKLSDTILCQLPSHVTTGAGYLVRVVSSNSAVTGSAYPTAITINDRPFATTIAGRTQVNGNATWLYSATNVATSSYTWVSTGGSFVPGSPTSSGNMQWNQPTTSSSTETLKLVETSNKGCVGDTSQLDVTVYKLKIDNTPANNFACKAFGLNVNIDVDGAIDAGNVYTAELSNELGSFAAPTAIGSITANGNGLAQTHTINTTIPAGLPNGTQYRIRVTSNNPNFTGNINTTPIEIIKPNMGADISRSKCQGFNYDLTTDFATAGLMYQYFDNSFALLGSNSVDVGTYNIVGTNTNGCKDTVVVTITNYPKPAMGTDISRSKCQGFNYDLTTDFTTAGLTYQYFNNSFAALGSNSVDVGTFNVIGINTNGCKDTVVVTITNYPKPAMGADITRSKCLGFNYNLTTDFTTAGLTYQYFNNSFVALGSNSVDVGTYNVIGTNANGCKDTVVVTITNFAIANTSAITNTSTVNLGGVYTYSVSNTIGSTYAWTLNNGTQNSGGNSNSITGTFNVQGMQTISVTETTNNNCIGTAVTANINVINLNITPSISVSTICISEPLPVSYTINGAFAVGNVFTIQLSDASGSFTAPINIGTLSLAGVLANNTGVVNCNLPNTLTPSMGYKCRIISSLPNYTSTNSTTAFEITPTQNTYSLSNDIIVNANLDLNNPPTAIFSCFGGGKITLGNYNLTVNGALTGFDATHYIVTNGTGKLCINNASSQNNTYPVATSSSSPNFVQINNTGTSDVFCVSVTNGMLLGGTTGTPVANQIVNKTWFIDEAIPGGSNATIALSWNETDELLSFNRNNCYVTHYGTFWDVNPVGASTGSGPYTISRSGVTSFSPFGVSSNIIPLAVKWIKTDGAINSNNKAQLTWTIQETNTQLFEIESSNEGITFNTIGQTASIGDGTNNYTFITNNYALGTLYYRIKQINTNGVFSYSKTVKIAQGEYTEIKLLQNVITNNLSFINYNTLLTGKTYTIYNSIGSLMAQGQIGSSINTIIASKWTNGVYFLKINNHIYKVIKQN